MSNLGHICLHRKLLEWEWYSDINTCRLFIHMLFKANWKDGKFRGTTVPRGSFISSISNLALETNLTNKEIRTAISHLKTTGEVAIQTTNRFSVFSIKNYDLYQYSDTQDDNQGADNGQPNGNQRATIEKGNKEINKEREKEGTNVPKKKVPSVYFPDNEELNRAFADYADMRKQIKKPLTDRAAELAVKKLHELAAMPFGDEIDDELAVRILEQSVMNCWQGLFPLKEQDGRKDDREKGGDKTGTENKDRRQAADFYLQFLGDGDGD